MEMQPVEKFSKETIERAVSQCPWYHTFELPYGVVTPGICEPKYVLKELDILGLPLNCSQKRVLDLGCRDGFFSFEMEKRGAEVIGIDNVPPHKTGFSVASSILNSSVKYYTDNVYNLTPKKYGFFDIVLFLGLFYHLRHPLLVLDSIRAVTSPGSLVFVETHLIDNYVLLPNKEAVKLSEISPLLEQIPLIQYYPKGSLNNDGTNHFGCNLCALKALFESAQFKVINAQIYGSRGLLLAQSIEDADSAYWKNIDATSRRI